jgi:hypothetical protein
MFGFVIFIKMKGRQSYAPFGSVSNRTKKQKQKIMDPGPGSYEVSLPIIIPIVQTIRKKNNNVIVKLGHLGTASFQNDEDRFKASQLPSVGPGQCTIGLSSDSPEKMEEHRKKIPSKVRSVAGEKVREYIKNQPNRSPAITEIKEL